MSCLQHTKRLSKGQVCTDVRGKQHPPVVHISSASHGICLDFVDSKKSLVPHGRLPILDKVGSTERAGQELPPGSVFARIKHGEDTCLGEVGQSQVPFTLHVFCADLVNLLEGIEVCHSDLIGRQSNDRAILLVQRVDVEDPLASDNCSLQSEMCEASVPRPWQMPCRARQTHVEELVQSASGKVKETWRNIPRE